MALELQIEPLNGQYGLFCFMAEICFIRAETSRKIHCEVAPSFPGGVSQVCIVQCSIVQCSAVHLSGLILYSPAAVHRMEI